MSKTNLPIPTNITSALSAKHLLSQPHEKQPVLYIDRSIITDKYEAFTDAFPMADIHYAMKCNPDKSVLQHIKDLGGNFEIASYAELEILQSIGVNPVNVLYSNPVKSSRDIHSAYEAGLRCFAFQSEDELHKLAGLQAVDVKVYVRLAVATGSSTVASEAKFGQPIQSHEDQTRVVELMKLAVQLGLEPYGVAFHVGSQMENPEAWTDPLQHVASLLEQLDQGGIRISMVDLGGGFPAYHSIDIPALSTFGAAITRELAKLPYPLKKIALEPGRALVSDAGALVAEVYGTALRSDQRWVYISVGAFNGLMEALETDTALQFPMIDERQSPEQVAYVVSGPSCDSQDTIAMRQPLSSDICEGDRVIIYTAGAYTTAYASHFNGFEPPHIVYVG